MVSGTSTGPDLDSWYSSVAAVLAKSARKDPAELGPDAWRELVATTVDGVEVNPLYTRADEVPERSAPGEFPFVRGGDRDGLPESGWHVEVRVDATDRAGDTNTEILALLAEGASSLWLRAGARDVAPALKGVYLDLAPVTFDAGDGVTELTQAYLDLLDMRAADGDGVTDRSMITAVLGVAPLTDAHVGAATTGLDTAVELAARVAERAETIRTFVADGTVFHDRGAGDVQEIAYALAAGVEYVRAMVNAGMTTRAALGQVTFRLSATDDQFQSIAKLRAARMMWARVAQVLGESDAGAAPQHVVTSAPMMSRRDPWVNMLRTTLSAFGAGIGGATSVTVRPFDSSIPGGLEGTSRGFAERMARNTQLLLIEESHLGHVVDPAGGSWYVESLTDTLAGNAWEVFQGVEAAGGLASALASGSVDDSIAGVRRVRDDAVARRALPLTGLSEFPNLSEPPLDEERRGGGPYRYGQEFEALRDRSDAHLAEEGRRPTVLLAGLGPLAEISGRTTFIANLLAAGGIDHRNPGTVTAGDYADAVSGDGAETVAVLCGADRRYATEGPGAVEALRAAGVEKVYVAGPEKNFPGDASGAGRPDGFLAMGLDAVEALTTLLDQLGVK